MIEFLNGLSGYLTQSPLLAYIAVFIGGILSSLTPCIYPMIPITIGVIGGSTGGSRLKGFLLSLIYVLGIAITYSTLGVISALSGRFFGEIATSPIVNLIMGNIYILLGLSMLDVISFPSFSFKSRIKWGGFVRVFFLGIFSGLVATPCMTPILGAILFYVATKQNILFGASLLFIFSMGMGFLLIFIGTFAGILVSLPKPGPWMEKTKKILGFLLIAIGEYFIFLSGRF